MHDSTAQHNPVLNFQLISLPLLEKEDYPKLLQELQSEPTSDIIICGGSKKVIETLYLYKTQTNHNLKVIAVDYDFDVNYPTLNETVSFSINQNTHQLSFHAITLLYNYLHKQILPTSESVAIESQIMINES